jgi:hypothetical protein
MPDFEHLDESLCDEQQDTAAIFGQFVTLDDLMLEEIRFTMTESPVDGQYSEGML